MGDFKNQRLTQFLVMQQGFKKLEHVARRGQSVVAQSHEQPDLRVALAQTLQQIQSFIEDQRIELGPLAEMIHLVDQLNGAKVNAVMSGSARREIDDGFQCNGPLISEVFRLAPKVATFLRILRSLLSEKSACRAA
jgi:hypothetical protein